MADLPGDYGPSQPSQPTPLSGYMGALVTVLFSLFAPAHLSSHVVVLATTVRREN
jgi:hypothetical protein